MSNKNYGFGTQIKKSPYFDSTVKWGATGFSVYNHMYIPRDFGSPERNFWNLIGELKTFTKQTQYEIHIVDNEASLHWIEDATNFNYKNFKLTNVSEKEYFFENKNNNIFISNSRNKSFVVFLSFTNKWVNIFFNLFNVVFFCNPNI